MKSAGVSIMKEKAWNALFVIHVNSAKINYEMLLFKKRRMRQHAVAAPVYPYWQCLRICWDVYLVKS